MIRRRFVVLLAGAGATAAWPGALLPAEMPVIGYLDPALDLRRHYLAAFREELAARGFVEARDVALELRSANGDVARLPELAADLVQRRVAVIVAAGPPAALAAQRATTTVPIVFSSGADPVKIGLVASYSRPGGNITGFHLRLTGLVAKRLALLRELKPGATRVAVLVNPANSSDTEQTLREAAEAARALSLETQTFNVSAPSEIDAVFTALVGWRPDVLLVGPDPFLIGPRAKRLATLAAGHALPSSGFIRGWADAGGLMSYGPDVADGYRQVARYAARILRGERPADLPVVQPTKYEMVINLSTAKALGLKVPPALLARADDVLE